MIRSSSEDNESSTTKISWVSLEKPLREQFFLSSRINANFKLINDRGRWGKLKNWLEAHV